jgi:hypothetical protein
MLRLRTRMIESLICAAVIATGGAFVVRTVHRGCVGRSARADAWCRLEAFLRDSRGPLELRFVADRRRLRLEHPTAEQVVALAGEEGAELWRLEDPGGVAFVAVPPRLRAEPGVRPPPRQIANR